MEATESPGFFKRLFMNPLAVRELRVACRSWKLVIILTAYLLIQGSIFSIWVYVASNSKGMYEDPTSIGSGLFTTMSAVLVVVVMLVFPAFSSTAIASEHERKSFDLLLLTPLSPWEIAFGKFTAAALQASIFLVATVPLFAIANLFGGIDPAVFFVTVWMLILLSFLISFVGVYASSLVKKAIPAVLVTYLFAFMLGFVMLVGFIVLQVGAALAAAAFPLVSFFTNPTLGEGVYYVTSLSVTCAVYCTFLFLSTTNRLKPTSHNKSTGLRLFWSAVAIIVPIQVAGYFMVSRLPSHNAAYGTLILGAVYAMLLMLVPALTAPAEAPVPSRRVRREMEKMPQGLLNGGGKIFFPGGDRGVVHTALITVVTLIMMVIVGWITFGELESRLDDKAMLAQDYQQVHEIDRSNMFAPGGAPAITPAMIAMATAPESELRETVTTYYGHEFNGYLALLLVLGVTVMLTAQVTWRLTLSGISRSLSGVLGGLIIAVVLVVPYIAQAIGGSTSEMEDQVVSQFSPIQASMNAVSWGKQSGKAAITAGPSAKNLESRADAFQWRWMTYSTTAGALALALLSANLVSRRKILERIKQLTDGVETVPEPVQATREQVEKAIAAVTAPELAAPPPPAMPAQVPPPELSQAAPPAEEELPDFNQVVTDDPEDPPKQE